MSYKLGLRLVFKKEMAANDEKSSTARPATGLTRRWRPPPWLSLP